MRPSSKMRSSTFARDGWVCASCGRGVNLEFQHRRAVGSGGSMIAPTHAEGLTSCARCNWRYESDLQAEAVRFGWKVRRHFDAALVPVFYVAEGRWAIVSGEREWISAGHAARMMDAVYGTLEERAAADVTRQFPKYDEVRSSGWAGADE